MRQVIIFLCLLAFLAPASQTQEGDTAQGAISDVNSPDTQRLKELIRLLESISDEDYESVIGREANGKDLHAQVASRKTALKSAYTAMAALAYREASSRDSAPAAEQGASAYKRLTGRDAGAAENNLDEIHESGWAIDLLKWLGNASINYALNGGETLVGRSIGNLPGAMTRRRLARLEGKLSQEDLSPDMRAELQLEVGQAFEELADTALSPQTEEERAEKKKAKLRRLAFILEGVSDEEYEEAVKASAETRPGKVGYPSRAQLLKSAYSTLAVLEYQQAGRAESSANSETLQEAGWITDFLGLAALGGIAYAIYNNQRKHQQHDRRPTPPTSAPNRQPLTAPASKAVYDGPWTMQWSFSFSGYTCRPKNIVEVTGGKFSYAGTMRCLGENTLGDFQFGAQGGIRDDGAVAAALKIGNEFSVSLSSGSCRGGICRLLGLGRIYPRISGTDPTVSFVAWDQDVCPKGNCNAANDTCTSGQAPKSGLCFGGYAPSTQPVPCPEAWTLIRNECIDRRGLGPILSVQAAGFNDSINELHAKLAGLEINSPREAELHNKLGAIYEKLAGGVGVSEAPKASPDAEEPEPSFEELQKRDSQQLEDWNKQQREDYRKMRGG